MDSIRRRDCFWFAQAGDLNAENHDAAIRFLLDGEVGADDGDWVTGDTFHWGYASSRKARARAVEAFGAQDQEGSEDCAVSDAEPDLPRALDAMIAAQTNERAAERRSRATACRHAAETTRGGVSDGTGVHPPSWRLWPLRWKRRQRKSLRMPRQIKNQ